MQDGNPEHLRGAVRQPGPVRGAGGGQGRHRGPDQEGLPQGLPPGPPGQGVREGEGGEHRKIPGEVYFG